MPDDVANIEGVVTAFDRLTYRTELMLAGDINANIVGPGGGGGVTVSRRYQYP